MGLFSPHEQRLRVLTVDDDSEAAGVTKRFLEKRMELDVDVAADYTTALSMLSSSDYDIVLVDTVPSEKPEHRLLERIAETAEDAALIIVTGEGDENFAAHSYELGATAYVIKDGKVPGNLLNAVESAMTEHFMKRADDLFKQQQALTDAALDNCSEIFMAVADDYSLLKWNARLREVSGYSDDELCHLTTVDILDQAGAGRLKRIVRGLNGERFAELDTHLVAKDRASTAYCMKVGVHKDAAGNPAAAFLVGRPVERVMGGDRARELEENTRHVSRGLRVPLSSIMVAAEMLQMLFETSIETADGKMIPQMREQITEISKTICSHSEQAVLMVEEILSHAETAQVPVASENVVVGDVVGRVVRELGSVITRKGIEVITDEDLGTVKADQVHIYRLFENLFTNAARHGTCGGRGRPVIEVRSWMEGKVNAYLFRDNGPGIADDELQSAFAPFVKGPGGGTGLGLATVQGIVEMYGGEIRAFNDDGACFEFTLSDA